MELFAEESVLDKLQEKIVHLRKRLRAFNSLRHVGDIRQRGIMVGIELVALKDTREPFPPADKIGHRVTMEARKRGLIIRPLGNVIVLMPPLSMTISEMDRLCDIAFDSIRAVTENM